ncbi:unnamed protein product, partial [Meganyctiphanes norvegica]
SELFDGILRFAASCSDVFRETFSYNGNTSCGLSSQDFLKSEFQKDDGTSYNILGNFRVRKKTVKSRNTSSNKSETGIDEASCSTSFSDSEEMCSNKKDISKDKKRARQSKFKLNRLKENTKLKKLPLKIPDINIKGSCKNKKICKNDVKKDNLSLIRTEESKHNHGISNPSTIISPNINIRPDEIFKKENIKEINTKTSPKVSAGSQKVNTSQQYCRDVDKKIAGTPRRDSTTPRKFFKTPRKFRENLSTKFNIYEMYKSSVIGSKKVFTPQKVSLRYVSPKREENFDALERFKAHQLKVKNKKKN